MINKRKQFLYDFIWKKEIDVNQRNKYKKSKK